MTQDELSNKIKEILKLDLELPATLSWDDMDILSESNSSHNYPTKLFFFSLSSIIVLAALIIGINYFQQTTESNLVLDKQLTAESVEVPIRKKLDIGNNVIESDSNGIVPIKEKAKTIPYSKTIEREEIINEENLQVQNELEEIKDEKFIEDSIVDSFSCVIIGKIINRESTSLKIQRLMDDHRAELKEIKIEGNKFYYKLRFVEQEVYQLIFSDELQKGRWRPIKFFPEINDTIYMELNSEDEFDKNIIKGKNNTKEFTKLNNLFNPELSTLPKEIIELSDSLSYLFENVLYHSFAYNELLKKLEGKNQNEKIEIYDQMDKLENNNMHLSPKAKIMNKKLKVFTNEFRKNTLELITTNPSLVGYSLLMDELSNSEFEFSLFQDYKRAYKVFSKKYPKHRYSDLIRRILESREKLKVGSPFIDLTARNLQTKEDETLLTIISHINEGVLFLDLWASWCGPCIAHSRSLIPIYHQYKDKGLSVLGVAREFGSTSGFEAVLKREKYPWKNLVELDDKNKIWLNYNIPFAGGGRYLISNDGTLLSINPSADELNALLEKHLK